MPPENKLTTVALDWAQYARLADYKAENRLRSFNAAIKDLLDAAEVKNTARA
ncbi:MAG: hypothetical protein WC138_12355 [Methanoculleus sp.]|jgi:hypothetical protein